MVKFAKEAGEFYKLTVPLDASYAIGRNWAGYPVAGKDPAEARKVVGASTTAVGPGAYHYPNHRVS